MGLYDRDYGRNDGYSDSYGRQPGVRLDGPRSLATNLVILNFIVYVIQIFTQPAQPVSPGDSGWFTELFLLHDDVLTRPWRIFEFLTYGFLHSPQDMQHILFNMLGLWMFGRAIEQRLGRNEFLAFYLIAIIFAGLFWFTAHLIASKPQDPAGGMLGASGGLSAVLILFILYYPHQKLFVFPFPFPLPAWIVGVFFVGHDILGAVNRTGNVAYTAHLGGVLFGFLYYRFGWRLNRWLPGNLTVPQFNKPTLRVHEPDNDQEETDAKVDEILKKIQTEGQDSLTRRERRFLEKASQEYQRKRR